MQNDAYILNFMWKYKTKCKSEMQSQLWSNFKTILADINKKNIASASDYELKFEPCLDKQKSFVAVAILCAIHVT